MGASVYSWTCQPRPGPASVTCWNRLGMNCGIARTVRVPALHRNLKSECLADTQVWGSKSGGCSCWHKPWATCLRRAQLLHHTAQLALPQLLDTESETDDAQTYPCTKALAAKQHSKWKKAHTKMPYSSLDVRTASSEEASINFCLTCCSSIT